MVIKILQKKFKPFVSASGDEIDYYWYVGKKGDDDGMSIRFGSVKGDYDEEKTYKIELEEVIFGNGKKGFKELVLS